jgi:hypothetical protein
MDLAFCLMQGNSLPEPLASLLLVLSRPPGTLRGDGIDQAI